MAFRLYTDKSSMRKKNSRILQGGIAEVDGRFIRWWERETFQRDEVSDVVYTISKAYEGNPDLISFDYYSRNDLGWLILQYNNIVDIIVELKVGNKIILPNKNRVFYEMITKPVASKRLVI